MATAMWILLILLILSQQWLNDDCGEPDWCGGADLPGSRDGVVDTGDLAIFVDNWLEGTK